MDLVSSLRRKVFELLDSVQPEARYKVLILDRRAKHILDFVVDRSELLNRQVANVLVLDEARSSEPYLEAVYIVEQSSYALGCITTDFVRRPPRYAAAHVFLLPRWHSSDAELQRFTNSPSISAATKKGKTLRHVEIVPLAFAAVEQRMFSLEVPHANLVLYNQACHNDVMEFVEVTGQQIAHACEVLGVAPYVRYTARWGAVRANAWPTLVARAAMKYIGERRAKCMNPQKDQQRSTLIILDRTVDLGAPLRHEFGFQALSMDITNGKGAAPSKAEPDHPAEVAGQPKRSIGVKVENFAGGYPNEKDTIWTDLRHKHIVVVTEQLNARISDLRSANPHLADMTNSQDVSVGDVRHMLAALPEFMKERESVAISLDLALECMTAIEQQNLKALAEFDQDVTLGTDTDGQEVLPGRLADMLVAVLAHPSADSSTKIRALALYAVYRQGLRRKDYERIQKHARMRDKDIAIVRALNYLGTPMDFDGAASREQLPPSLTREFTQQPLMFQRVKPGIQTVIEECVTGELSEQDYPFLGDAPDTTEEALNAATSLRNPRQRATWAQNVAEPTTSADSSRSDQQSRRSIIVFVLGGITAAEAAVAYRVSDQKGVSVFIGSHDIITPKVFIEFLGQINTPREQLRLPEDQPEPHVPEMLGVPDLAPAAQHRYQASQSSQSSQIDPREKWSPRTGSPVRASSPMKAPSPMKALSPPPASKSPPLQYRPAPQQQHSQYGQQQYGQQTQQYGQHQQTQNPCGRAMSLSNTSQPSEQHRRPSPVPQVPPTSVASTHLPLASKSARMYTNVPPPSMPRAMPTVSAITPQQSGGGGQVPGTSYNSGATGVQYLGNPPPSKDKKDMKGRLKGAFRLKR